MIQLPEKTEIPVVRRSRRNKNVELQSVNDEESKEFEVEESSKSTNKRKSGIIEVDGISYPLSPPQLRNKRRRMNSM